MSKTLKEMKAILRAFAIPVMFGVLLGSAITAQVFVLITEYQENQ